MLKILFIWICHDYIKYYKKSHEEAEQIAKIIINTKKLK